MINNSAKYLPSTLKAYTIYNISETTVMLYHNQQKYSGDKIGAKIKLDIFLDTPISL